MPGPLNPLSGDLNPLPEDQSEVSGGPENPVVSEMWERMKQIELDMRPPAPPVAVHRATLAELRDGDVLLLASPAPLSEAECAVLGRRLSLTLHLTLHVQSVRYPSPFTTILRRDPAPRTGRAPDGSVEREMADKLSAIRALVVEAHDRPHGRGILAWEILHILDGKS